MTSPTSTPTNGDTVHTITCGDIGEGQREWEFEPLEAPRPVETLEPTEAPAETPEREPVPA